jgi:hypothetical protein
MDKSQAREIAERHLATVQSRCPVEICFNDEVTQEHPFGFVFFYNSVRFWETRETQDALIGNGPILVRKDDGAVSSLPSYQSVNRSLEELAYL